MKHLLLWVTLAGCLALPFAALAWEGFDADTTDLVEITPDAMPSVGDAVDVRNYDNGSVSTCLVESVARNVRTVEVTVKTPDGTLRTLVMEGR